MHQTAPTMLGALRGRSARRRGHRGKIVSHPVAALVIDGLGAGRPPCRSTPEALILQALCLCGSLVPGPPERPCTSSGRRSACTRRRRPCREHSGDAADANASTGEDRQPPRRRQADRRAWCQCGLKSVPTGRLGFLTLFAPSPAVTEELHQATPTMLGALRERSAGRQGHGGRSSAPLSPPGDRRAGSRLASMSSRSAAPIPQALVCAAP